MSAIQFHARITPEIKVSASVHHDNGGNPEVAAVEVMGIEFTAGKFFDHVVELILDMPDLYDELSAASGSASSLAA